MNRNLVTFTAAFMAATLLAAPVFATRIFRNNVEQARIMLVSDTPEVAAKGFILDRETRMASLRLAVSQAADKAPRDQRRILRTALGNPDIMTVALAQVEYLQSQDPEAMKAMAEGQGPVMNFIQFIIDNWEKLKPILEFLVGLFAGAAPVADLDQVINHLSSVFDVMNAQDTLLS